MKKSLINICNAEWEIRVVTTKTLSKKYGYMKCKDELEGYTDFDNQRIYLNKELHPHRISVTLTHELLHVVMDSHGAIFPEEEEEIIRSLEHGVYEMIQKFPKEYK